jgi:hypothetical protein
MLDSLGIANNDNTELSLKLLMGNVGRQCRILLIAAIRAACRTTSAIHYDNEIVICAASAAT